MATSWRVTGDTPDQYEFDGAGNPVPGHRVAYITGAGNRGSVFIPNDHYNPSYIRTQINSAAGTSDAVATLASEG